MKLIHFEPTETDWYELGLSENQFWIVLQFSTKQAMTFLSNLVDGLSEPDLEANSIIWGSVSWNDGDESKVGLSISDAKALVKKMVEVVIEN